jgi:hypothetical protein
MSKRNKLLALGAASILAVGIGTYAFTASSEEGDHGFGPRSMQMGRGMMGHGMMGGGGMMHDHMMGSGMRGQGMHGQGMRRQGMMGGGMMGMGRGSATADDMGTIHELAVHHDKIKRTVENLPDGIRTVTESDDPEIAKLIKEHVAKMGERVRAGKMMRVPLESPAVHEIYRNKDKIRTTTEQTAKGVIVVQTSADPKIAKLLQAHAVEVTSLVEGGMEAMHGAMMRNMHGGNGAMMGPMMGMNHDGRGMRHGGGMHGDR